MSILCAFFGRKRSTFTYALLSACLRDETRGHNDMELTHASVVELRGTGTQIPMLGLGSSHQQGGLTAQAVNTALAQGIIYSCIVYTVTFPLLCALALAKST